MPGGLQAARTDHGQEGPLQAAIRDFVTYIPRGDSIEKDTWNARHRTILVLLWVHVPVLFLLGLFDGHDPYFTGATYTAEPLQLVVLEVGAIAVLALLAGWSRFGQRTRAIIASVALMTCSAVLAHFWGGFIEAHFHFFVMVGVIAVYEDWLPFLLAILYVAIQHGLFGMIAPGAVYNHSPAIENPWGWAIIHAVFILGLSAAIVLHWRSIERARAETERQIQNLKESDDQIQNLEERQAEIERAKAEAESAKAQAEEAKSEAERRQREVEELNEQLLIRANEVAAAMEAVSDRDLTAEPPTDADIEAITEISTSFEEMTTELSVTIADLRAFTRTVEQATQSVKEDTETLEHSQRQQASDVREFASDLRELADDLESTTEELGDLSATIEEIAATTGQVSTVSSDAADAAEAGSATAAEAIDAIDHVDRKVSELAELVSVLDSRMDDVDESTGIIEDIADQTNLLALNANIEAARSGAGGDGFAVVADEVKSLADETRDHSTAIKQTIEQTIDDVDRVQTEMDRTRTRIETGKATVTDAGDTFTDLAETVDEVETAVTEVAAATDDGARMTEDVVEAVVTVADRSRTVADRSESLADSAEASATTIADVRSQLDDLAAQTTDLQGRLEVFECEATLEHRSE